MYSGMFDAGVDRRAPAMGQPGHLHSGDGLVRRAGRIARRHRRGNARSVSAAQAVGAAQRAIPRIRAHRPSALEPLELVGRRPLDQRRVGAHRAPDSAVRSGESHSRHDGQGRVSLLAPLRVHAGSSVAARSRLSDDQRRGGVLPALSRTCGRKPTGSTTSIT